MNRENLWRFVSLPMVLSIDESMGIREPFRRWPGPAPDDFYCEILRASSIWYSKYLCTLNAMLAVNTLAPTSSDTTLAPMVPHRVLPGAASGAAWGLKRGFHAWGDISAYKMARKARPATVKPNSGISTQLSGSSRPNCCTRSMPYRPSAVGMGSNQPD